MSGELTTKTKRFHLPYGIVEVPVSVLPLAARRTAGLAAASFNLATTQQIAMGAYLQGIEDCYTALEHTGKLNLAALSAQEDKL